MALSASVLSAAIKAQRIAGNPSALIENNAALQKDCDAIAAAVVAHIQAAAVVNVPALGLFSPPGTAGGPVTGSAAGTIT